jgi:hypothetical protein
LILPRVSSAPQPSSATSTRVLSLSLSLCYYHYFHLAEFSGAGQFILETAYTAGPKLQTDDIAKQQKKKTIFVTDLAFPYVRTRMEITGKREVLARFMSPVPVDSALCTCLYLHLCGL